MDGRGTPAGSAGEPRRRAPPTMKRMETHAARALLALLALALLAVLALLALDRVLELVHELMSVAPSLGPTSMFAVCVGEVMTCSGRARVICAWVVRARHGVLPPSHDRAECAQHPPTTAHLGRAAWNSPRYARCATLDAATCVADVVVADRAWPQSWPAGRPLAPWDLITGYNCAWPARRRHAAYRQPWHE